MIYLIVLAVVVFIALIAIFISSGEGEFKDTITLDNSDYKETLDEIDRGS